MTLYTGGTQLARVSANDILNKLQSTTVSALNGTAYQSSAYKCNPNGPGDCVEPFLYVSLVTTTFTFDKVVLDNSAQTGTGFESDNHSVANGIASIPGSFVRVESLSVTLPVTLRNPPPFCCRCPPSRSSFRLFSAGGARSPARFPANDKIGIPLL